MGKRFSSGPPQFPTTLHHNNSVVVQHVANPGSTKMFLMILVSEVIRHSDPSEYGALTGVTRNRPGQVLSPPPQDHSLDPIRATLTLRACINPSLYHCGVFAPKNKAGPSHSGPRILSTGPSPHSKHALHARKQDASDVGN
jgi:hypothetical protein